MPEVSEKYEISSVPTFLFFKVRENGFKRKWIPCGLLICIRFSILLPEEQNLKYFLSEETLMYLI